jgi:myo-inositol-1(or 4)-monophosphatase
MASTVRDAGRHAVAGGSDVTEYSDQEMHDFVESAIRRAGQILLSYFRAPNLTIEAKGVGDLVTEADRASEASLIAAIRDRFPDHGIISEEMGAINQAAQFLWLLDPLEATYNFSRGLPLWGINVALEIAGRVHIGAFFDPLLDELYYAERSVGVLRNGTPIRTSRQEDLREAVVYCSTRENVDLVSGAARKFRHIGSVGNALAYVAAGHLDAAIEVGGGRWDYAAGSLLVEEAGGAVSVINSGPQSPPPKSPWPLRPPHSTTSS